MAIRIAVLTLLAAWVTTVTLPAQAQFETRATFFMGPLLLIGEIWR